MRRSILQTKFYLLSVLLSLASCSQDELTEQGTALPEGMYPMTFTAVQVAPENTPQTRVSDYDEGGEHKSKWTTGDKITVTVSKDGYTEKTTCTLDENGKITEYSPQLYWQTTENYDINAWYYSNITGQGTETENAVSLANQSGGLAYVLKADSVTENYKKGNIALTFSHQLAKVRVKLENGTYQGDLSEATVRVKGYTSCTVTNGDVSEGSEVGYITMCKNGEYYEANLVPGTLQASEAFEISTGDKTTKASLKGDVSLEKGQVHEITINVKQATLKPIDGKFTVNGGNVLIKNHTGNEPIVVNGNATITLDNVKLTTEVTAMEINSGATVTLNVVGTNNSLTSTNGSGIGAHENCNITIQGEGTDNSKLEVSSGEGHNVGIGFITVAGTATYNYGGIKISDVTLSVTASTGGSGTAGAAIGVTGSVAGWANRINCGDITINNSNVTANSKGGAAGIGTGLWSMQHLSMGVISIAGSTVTVTSGNDGGGWGPACIGMGVVECGTADNGGVTIQKINIEKSELDLTVNGRYTYKVGKGTVHSGTATITIGIIVDKIWKSSEGWNP